MFSQYGSFLPYLVPLLVVLLIVRRGLRSRRIRIERMWIMPTLLVLAGASLFAAGGAPQPRVMAALAGGAAAGAIVGWYRGRLTHITIDPDTHDLTSRTSPVGVVLIAVLFAIRYGVRLAAGYGQAGALQGRAGAITDALALFAIAAMVVQRLEMWIRCRKLLAEAKAGPPPPTIIGG